MQQFTISSETNAANMLERTEPGIMLRILKDERGIDPPTIRESELFLIKQHKIGERF